MADQLGRISSVVISVHIDGGDSAWEPCLAEVVLTQEGNFCRRVERESIDLQVIGLTTYNKVFLHVGIAQCRLQI
jgi:hypothetical protein